MFGHDLLQLHDVVCVYELAAEQVVSPVSDKVFEFHAQVLLKMNLEGFQVVIVIDTETFRTGVLALQLGKVDPVGAVHVSTVMVPESNLSANCIFQPAFGVAGVRFDVADQLGVGHSEQMGFHVCFMEGVHCRCEVGEVVAAFALTDCHALVSFIDEVSQFRMIEDVVNHRDGAKSCLLHLVEAAKVMFKAVLVELVVHAEHEVVLILSPFQVGHVCLEQPFCFDFSLPRVRKHVLQAVRTAVEDQVTDQVTIGFGEQVGLQAMVENARIADQYVRLVTRNQHAERYEDFNRQSCLE